MPNQTQFYLVHGTVTGADGKELSGARVIVWWQHIRRRTRLASGLASNGGFAPTQQPLSGSPAIDAIPAGTSGCGTFVTSDQCGAPRPINGKCDIGAVEAGRAHPALWLPLLQP